MVFPAGGRVSPESVVADKAIADAVSPSSPTRLTVVEETLVELLDQMKIMNSHLEILTENQFSPGESLSE